MPRLQHRFALPAVALMAAGAAGAALGATLTDPPWSRTATFQEVLAAYPDKARAARVGGSVELACTFTSDGRLTRCETLAEKPGGLGFAAAARTLAGAFVGPLTLSNGKSVAGHRGQFTVTFAPDMLDAATVPRPVWIALPTPARFQTAFPEAASKAGVLKARSVIDCLVDAAGGLTDCRPVSEEPAGYGFAAAAVPLAPDFRMRLWGGDGRPVVGARVRVPIRFDLKQAPTP